MLKSYNARRYALVIPEQHETFITCPVFEGLLWGEFPRISLLGDPVNRHALISRAVLPYRSGSPPGSPQLAQNEKNRAGKRYHERRKEMPKAVA
jgi:hypothetical protein